MNLVYCEWRKLFHLPALWAFLGLCLVFNGLLIATQSPYDRAFFNDTSADAELLGQRVDGEFLAGLSAMPETENRMHGADEFAVIDELVASAEIFAQVIIDLCA